MRLIIDTALVCLSVEVVGLLEHYFQYLLNGKKIDFGTLRVP